METHASNMGIPAIARVHTSLAYRLWLALVSLVVVLLPLVYAAIVAASAAFCIWWAVEGGPAAVHDVRNTKAIVMGYLGPLVVSGILTAFMCKPFFARRARPSRAWSVDRAHEPVLFAFAEAVARGVGSPLPRRVDLDMEVNASASFRRGLRSFLGSDLVLTIGLPLAAGLSKRDLAGVLAHEFGHFTQGAAMRMSYLIRSINAWFYRVATQRDAWDETLRKWSDLDARIAWIAWVARLLVWLTRRILWVLMYLSHLVSFALLRQMEFDADCYEIRMTGSEAFAGAFKRMRVLAAAHNGAHADLSQAWNENRLGDDLLALIEANIGQIPKELLARIEHDIAGEKAGAFSSHPSDAQRIARAARERTPGVYHDESSAKELFTDFAATARQFTLRYYREVLGVKVGEKNLCRTADIVSRVESQQRDGEAFERFFQGCLSSHVPFAPAGAKENLPADVESLRRELAACRDSLVERAPKAGECICALNEASNHLGRIHAVRALQDAGFNCKAGTAGIPDVSPAGLDVACDAVVRRRDLECGILTDVVYLAGRRLQLALALAPHLEAAARPASQIEESARLLPVLDCLNSLAKTVASLEGHVNDLRLVAQQLQPGRQPSPQTVTSIRNNMAKVRGDLNDLTAAGATTEYPFDHAQGRISVGTYLFQGSTAGAPENLGGVLDDGIDALRRYYDLAGRIHLRLAAIGEAIETALGLAPTPAPRAQK